MKNKEKPDFSSKIEIIRVNLLKGIYMYVSVNTIDLKERCND